jgi:hypothetical protein
MLSAFGWIVALTAIWSQVSAWTSYPVGLLSHMALEQTAPMWVRQVHLSPGNMEVDTAISVPTADGRRGESHCGSQPSALCLWAANLRCAGTDGPWPGAAWAAWLQVMQLCSLFRHSA